MTTLRPGSEWASLHGVKILDNDGWRRNDGVSLSTPITAEDYDSRIADCTVLITTNSLSGDHSLIRDSRTLSHVALRVRDALRETRRNGHSFVLGLELDADFAITPDDAYIGIKEINGLVPGAVSFGRTLRHESLFGGPVDGEVPAGLSPNDTMSWVGVTIPNLILPGPRAYLSGPITGIGLEEADRRFGAVEDWASEELALEVTNPMSSDVVKCKNPSECIVSTPEEHWRHCMRDCLSALITLDISSMIILPGWNESRGARIEVEVARALGIRLVVLSSTDLNRILLGYGSDGKGL